MQTVIVPASELKDDLRASSYIHRRGFASLSPEKRSEIARMGGKAASAGNGHKFTTAEAKAAGSKGGAKISQNREHMSRIGKIGGSKNKGKKRPTV